MNEFDYAALHAHARLTRFLLLTGALRASFEAGRVWAWPLRLFPDRRSPRRRPATGPRDPAGDAARTPPDFVPSAPAPTSRRLVWPRARRRLALRQPQSAARRARPDNPVAALDVAIEADGPFITAEEAPPTAEQRSIAERIAALVPDGAAIQTRHRRSAGGGRGRLAGRRGLAVRSGMVTQGYREPRRGWGAGRGRRPRDRRGSGGRVRSCVGRSRPSTSPTPA